MTVKLAWLPAVIPWGIGLWFYICAATLYIYKRSLSNTTNNAIHPEGSASSGSLTWTQVYHKLLHGKDFSYTYQSGLGTIGAYLLLILRMWGCGYYVGVVMIWNYVRRKGVNAFYFTLWNVDLISCYYSVALVASLIGLVHDKVAHAKPGEIIWSKSMMEFGYMVQFVFEFTGATALFITVVNFALLDPSIEFWNVNFHLLTSIGLLIEMWLNKIPVRPEHLILQVSWAFAYMVFCWPMAGTGAIEHWPYFFFRTGSGTVLAWYAGLYVLDCLFFAIWWAIGQVKYRYLNITDEQASAGTAGQLVEMSPVPNQQPV